MIPYGCHTFFTIILSYFSTCYFFPTIDLVSWWIFLFSSLLWSILILSYKFSGVPIFILFGNNVVPFIISSHSDICMFINIYVDVVVSFPFHLFFNLLLLSPLFFLSFFWDISIGYVTVLIRLSVPDISRVYHIASI